MNVRAMYSPTFPAGTSWIWVATSLASNGHSTTAANRPAFDPNSWTISDGSTPASRAIPRNDVSA